MVELFRLHQARWAGAGIRGLFTLEANRTFHLDLAREFERLGWLDLTAYLLDDHMVSVHLCAVLDGVVYLLRSGRDPALARYSVGHLHELRMLRSWVAAGLYEADLLRGAEPYKYYWTRKQRTYVELYVSAFRGARAAPLRLENSWRWLVRFLRARHSARELWSYVVLRRREARERRRMGVEPR
jgi:CelD/BcsL family acetyltransferase involved in cellulose biosynthesis